MDKVIDVDIIEDDRDKSEKKDFIPPEILYDAVSYTHLTLPTN